MGLCRDEGLRYPDERYVGVSPVSAIHRRNFRCEFKKLWLTGEIHTCAGKPYNNDYVWLTQWNDEGKVSFFFSFRIPLLASW